MITRRALLAGAASAIALSSLGCAKASGEADTSASPSTSEDVAPVDESSPVDADNSSSSDSPRPLEVFDMHADTIDALGMISHAPYSEFNDKFSGTLASSNAQVSADRMGGARWAQCYAIWIPDAEGDSKGDIPAIEWYREGVKWFKGQMEQLGDRFTQVRDFSEIPSILDEGKVAAILTVENAACLDAGIEVVDEFASDGVLIAGLTWNYTNALGSGNNYPEVGLTDLGKEYISALEQRNIIVDVSHLNEKGFWELDEVATKPYIATHSNARAICDHARNLTDEQFQALISRGGIVGLNFNDGFVREGGHAYTFDELCAHVEHWLDLGGENAIALGADRDGADIPSWLADCSSQQYLFDYFAQRLGDDIARKLFFDNAMAFFA